MSDLKAARGVLFDKDGTLLDFQRTWAPFAARLIEELANGDDALADALAEDAGFDRARALYEPHSPLVGGDGFVLMSRWVERLPAHSAGTLKAFVMTRAVDVIRGGLAPASRDLDALLSRLAERGLALGLATHDLELSARAQLRTLRIAARFGFVAGSDSGYPRKPDPAVLRGFCAAAGCAPGEVVVVGDSPIDLELARAGGALAAVAVLTGPTPRETLAPIADVVLESIDDLPGLLGV